MKRLSIYITPGHSSITVQNGVSRETSGPELSMVLDAMPACDRTILNAFCAAVLNYMDPQDANGVNAIAKG